jgi:hypothetical protein
MKAATSCRTPKLENETATTIHYCLGRFRGHPSYLDLGISPAQATAGLKRER